MVSLLQYGGSFYVPAAQKKSIPPEKIQQYIIEYYNKEAKPLGEKAARYLKDHLVDLRSALEYYRKLGLSIQERPFTVAIGRDDLSLYNERLEDSTDNYYMQMSRLTSKTNQRFDTDYKNLVRDQPQEVAAANDGTPEGSEDTELDEETLQWLNENDKEVRTVVESLHQSLIELIENEYKATVQLIDRTKTDPFLLMLTRYDDGKASWMIVADRFKFGLDRLFEEVDTLQEAATDRFEKAKLRLDIQRGLPQEQLGKEAMTAPKQLTYNGRVYHLVEAAETKPKFEGFPEIPMGKEVPSEDLLEKAKAIRGLAARLRPVSAREGSGEVTHALKAMQSQLDSLMAAYEMLADFEEFFPKKLKLMGNPQEAQGLHEMASAKINDVLAAFDLWGKNMGKWARSLDEVVEKRKLKDVRRPDPTDDPSTMKAPPQTLRF